MSTEVLFMGTASPGVPRRGPVFGTGTLISPRFAEVADGKITLRFEAEMPRPEGAGPTEDGMHFDLLLMKDVVIEPVPTGEEVEPFEDVIWPAEALGGRLTVLNDGNLPVDFSMALVVYSGRGQEGSLTIRPRAPMHAVCNTTDQDIPVEDAVREPRIQKPGDWLIIGHNGNKFVVTPKEFEDAYERTMTLADLLAPLEPVEVKALSQDRVGGRIRVVSDGTEIGCCVFTDEAPDGLMDLVHLRIDIDAHTKQNEAVLTFDTGEERVVKNPIILIDPPDQIPLTFESWEKQGFEKQPV